MSKNIESGLVFHKQGNFEAAERLYLEELKLAPESIDAHNLISCIYFELDKLKEALYHANFACSLTNDHNVLNNRGRLLLKLEKTIEAISDFKNALKLDPKSAEILNNLCYSYMRLGDYRKAIKYGLLSNESSDKVSELYDNLANSFYLNGDYADALLYYRDKNNPKFGKFTLGELYCSYKTEDFKYAVDNIAEAIEKNPNELALYFVGIDAAMRLSNFDSALYVLEKLNQFECFNENINFFLDQEILFGPLVKSLSFAATIEGGSSLAESLYKKLISFAKNSKSSLLVNLGVLYFNAGNFKSAIYTNESAIADNPKQIWAYNNLGVVAMAEKRSLDAIGFFQNALEIDENFSSSLGWLLKEKLDLCDWENYDFLIKKIKNKIDSSEDPVINAITSLAVFDDPNLLHKVAKRLSREKFGFNNSKLQSSRHESKKYRVGFYSYDFRDHALARLIRPVFEYHDPEAFDIYTYSYGPDDGSDIRKFIMSKSNFAVDLSEKSISETAKLIADDKLDILIDLSGDTNGNRSEVFRYDIARFKMHWLGFIGTMGTDSYQYIIADSCVVPYTDERFFSEKILRLDPSFHMCDDDSDIFESSATSNSFGVGDDTFVFGVFSQTYKIQPYVFQAWLDILNSVPNSIIVLAEGPEGSSRNLSKLFAGAGLGERVKFVQRCSVKEYLRRFRSVDLMLDTYPYSSGTVASDALKEGCPVLALSGSTMASRMSASILSSVGLDSFVAYNLSDYVAKAISYGLDLPAAKTARLLLENRVRQRRLFETKKNVKNFEECLLKVLKSC